MLLKVCEIFRVGCGAACPELLSLPLISLKLILQSRWSATIIIALLIIDVRYLAKFMRIMIFRLDSI